LKKGVRPVAGDSFSRRRLLGAFGAGSFVVSGWRPNFAMADDFAEKPAPVVERAAALGKQFIEDSVGVTGLDGATSVVLPGGEALWVFGDTVEGPFESIRQVELAPLRSNTGAIVPRQDVSGGVKSYRFLRTADGRRPRQLVPFAEGENAAQTRLWAIHGASVGSRVYLYYHRISLKAGVDVFEDFQLEGMGLARADAGKFEFTRLAAPDGTREFWKGDLPTFGVWVEHDGDFLYVWGSLMTGMFLARVPAERVEELAAYEYLVEAPTLKRPEVKPRWAKAFAPAAVLFDSVPNEMSASYNAHLGRHVAIHALGRAGKIVMRTAAERTGPWSEPTVLYEAPRKAATDYIYAAKEHPELAADGGRRIYVTYVNSGVYEPEMVEIVLK
jgi:hypothetical protein